MRLIIAAFIAALSMALHAAELNYTVTWDEVTEMSDGTPATIIEYRVHYAVVDGPEGIGMQNLTNVVTTAPNSTADTQTIEVTPRPTPYYLAVAVTAVAANGNTATSDIYFQDFIAESTADPRAPTNVTIDVVCGDGCRIIVQ